MKTAVEFGCHSDHKISVCKPLEKKGWKVWYFGLEGGKDIIKCFITAENINQVFKENKVPKKLDLLSIDIDGMDYWVWKALEWKPKEVIIEYNPKRLKGVQPYFAHNYWNGIENDYYGASKEELIKLGKEKGYIFYKENQDNLFFKLYETTQKRIQKNP
jgi:hypothetical protein